MASALSNKWEIAGYMSCATQSKKLADTFQGSHRHSLSVGCPCGRNCRSVHLGGSDGALSPVLRAGSGVFIGNGLHGNGPHPVGIHIGAFVVMSGSLHLPGD